MGAAGPEICHIPGDPTAGLQAALLVEKVTGPGHQCTGHQFTGHQCIQDSNQYLLLGHGHRASPGCQKTVDPAGHLPHPDAVLNQPDHLDFHTAQQEASMDES